MVLFRHKDLQKDRLLIPLFLWKGGRVVEGNGLENRRGATHREFESHPFR